MEAEANLVNLEWVQSSNTYNLRTGGLYGTFCDLSKQRISKSNTGGKKRRVASRFVTPFDPAKQKAPKTLEDSRMERSRWLSKLLSGYAKERRQKRAKNIEADRQRLFGKD